MECPTSFRTLFAWSPDASMMIFTFSLADAIYLFLFEASSSCLWISALCLEAMASSNQRAIRGDGIWAISEGSLPNLEQTSPRFRAASEFRKSLKG
jgi:hypothetical protein